MTTDASPSTGSSRVSRLTRDGFRHFRPITTRWMDNDAFGHVNNVIYYSFFDTAVTAWLLEVGLMHPTASKLLFYVASSGCAYFESLAFPDAIEVGLRVARLGASSVRYDIGVFRSGMSEAAAQGHFVHVLVDRDTRRPVALTPEIRALLGTIA